MSTLYLDKVPLNQLLGTQSLGKELDNWTRLEQIMDMTEDEFIAEVMEDEDLFLERVQELQNQQAEEDEEEIN